MTNVVNFEKKKKDVVKLKSDFEIIQVVAEVRKEDFEYIIRDEIIKDPEGNPFKMTNCYSLHSGCYIGDTKDAVFLCETERLKKLQPAREGGTACNIGFDQMRGKWYGWSHRAVCAFGIGDMIFDEDYKGPDGDDTPFIKHGTEEIKTMAEARQAAINFARYVS